MKKALTYLLLIILSATYAVAQNATISPRSGHLISYDSTVGSGQSWGALWRHSQLPLSLVVSNKTNLSNANTLKDPAGNICLDENQGLYVIDGGRSASTYMNISLPKGFRFTHYRIVLLNNINGKTIKDTEHGNISKELRETNSKFSTTLASSGEMSGTNDNKEYVIERTSSNVSDMGNNLYFYFYHSADGYYGATIKSIELGFTAQESFTNSFSPSTIQSSGVNILNMPFKTGRTDFGEFSQQQKNGRTFLGYNSNNVKDLAAYVNLYQEDAVDNGALPTQSSSGKITTESKGNNNYYALGNGTYYIESPTSATDQSNNTIPLGYRITGAKVKAVLQSDPFYIYVTKVGDGTKYYLRTNCRYSRYSATKWHWDGDYITSNGYYLKQDGYNLTTTSNRNSASSFYKDDAGHIYTVVATYTSTTNYYLSSTWDYSGYSASGSFTYNSPRNSANAFVETAPSSSYNIYLYGTDKDNAVASSSIYNRNTSRTLTASNLNNDAVKIVIDGLGYGEKALISFSLDMEALNPFVSSFDVVAHANGSEQTSVRQTYDFNDFEVSGSKLDMQIPDGFADSDNKVKVSFDNLNSKYATNDYNASDVVSNPHARVYFVGSDYYNNYGDGKQYDANPDAAASTKVSTLSAGDKPFIYSNAVDLGQNSTTTSTSIKEYSFSLANYNEQGGNITNDVRVPVGEDKNLYLFVGDETKYNIAPTKTTEHRAYAYYALNMGFEVRTYKVQCTLKKIYDKTCYDGDKEDAMYGVSFQATDADGNLVAAADGATLGVQQMRDALTEALSNENINAKNVLYLDFSELANVNLNSDINAWKDELNANCLIYLPAGVAFTGANNIARGTATNGFQATGNIVITDKQPFYAPYEISVSAENYATYTRNITVDKNGKVANASIILPYGLALTDGIHTNSDNSCSFKVSRMNTEGCLKLTKSETANAKNYAAEAKFTKVTEASTKANEPYIVTVTDAPSEANISFIATQYGAKIEATPSSMNDVDYTFKGKESTGAINGATYNFVNYGSYSGEKLDKKVGYFYFSGNMFLCSKNLAAQRPYLYVLPFRAYYAYQMNGNTAKGIDKFGITFDDGTTTGIVDITKNEAETPINAYGGNGAIILSANKDTDFHIVTSTGATISAQRLHAGETYTLTVPAGLYIVNNKKVLVK